LSTQREIRDGSGGTTFVNFNGGTLQAAAATVGALFPTVDRVNVRDGGATIDTQGFDITTTKALEHSDIGGDSATDGGLTKLGSGSLTLGGANTYTGPTMVSEGTLGMTGTFTSDVSVADGATISGDGSNTTGSLTLGSTTGANLVVDADSPTGIRVGDLILNGVTNLFLPGGSGPFAVGTYSGILTDGNGGTLEDSFSVSGARAASITDTAGLIEVSVTTESSTWSGTTSGNWELGGSDANWTSSDTFFFDGDEVLFDDSGANKTVTLLADVAPGLLDINNTAGNDYTFQGGFGITGSTDLLKDGDGALTVLNDNSFTGGTTILAGSVNVGSGGTTGSLGFGTIVNDGALTYNRSDDLTQSVDISSSAITGTGSLTKAGAGNLTINVANTYTGGTTVSEGTLTFSGAGSTSDAGGILVENGGTIRFDRNDTWGAAATTSTPVITIDAGGVVESNNKYTPLIDLVLNGGTLSANDGVNANFPTFGLKGTVTVNATPGGSVISTTGAGDFNEVGIGSPGLIPDNVTVFDVADGAAASDLTVSAVLSNNGGGSKGLTKTGAGTMTLSASNIYTGTTTVSAGVLSLGNGTDNSNLADGADVELTTGATLDLNFAGTDQVDELFIDGVGQAAGTWGAIGSGAANETALITGPGLLEVLTAAGTPYANWAALFPGLTDTDPSIDFEGDGLDTAVEWVVGGDPTVNDAGPLQPTGTDTGTGLDFVFRRTDESNNDADTTIEVEYGSNLDNDWTVAMDGVDGVTIAADDDFYGPGIDRVTVSLPDSLALDGKLFARLNVTVVIP
ncbi:MAG: hypothetical protein HKN74_02295, partial [Acidimicrobiia bacterium]|nr:hypothetical protein [Acidimicrobiia bacterium]